MIFNSVSFPNFTEGEPWEIVLPSTLTILQKDAEGIDECEHNLASEFKHSEYQSGNYEYKQIGLQSNKEGDCYLTTQNTVDIINDAVRRELNKSESDKKNPTNKPLYDIK